MESQSKKRITVPKDIHIAWERNFSFLGTLLIANQHMKELKKYLGVSYSMCAFFHSKGQVQFFRSQREEENEGKLLANRCLKNEKYSREISNKIVRCINRINDFLSREKNLSIRNVEKFFALLNEHFVYHHAVYWAGTYLNQYYSQKSSVKHLKIIDLARKRDELILPATEKWLAKNSPDCLLLTPQECVDYIYHKKRPRPAELEKRNKASFVYLNHSKMIILTGQKAKKCQERYVRIFMKRFGFQEKSFRGKSVFHGKYKGLVRVITRFEDFIDLKRGEILATPMTIPEYIKYIKKVGAIITDEGGLLSHASILARELKIPCIIGTKIATKVLKNGDLVEVDADKGIVKILKSKK
jgi:phosphohistidine swiveling domain-containing protein